MSGHGNELLEAALDYARRYFAVLPLVAGGKKPDGQLVPRGLLQAQFDPPQIEKWWRLRSPQANVGINTEKSRLVVLDIDVKDGKDGRPFVEGRDLSGAVVVHTPSGGFHYYWRANGHTFKSGVDLYGTPGVDIRGDGGYVVAPPSIVGDKPYEIVSGDFDHIGNVPDWLVELEQERQRVKVASSGGGEVTPGEYGPEVLERARAKMRDFPPAVSGQGGHVQTLKAATALMVGFALTEDDAMRILLEEYNPRCVPPWTEKELRHKVEDAAKNERGFAPRYLLAEHGGTEEAAEDVALSERCTLADIPEYVPEEQDPNILVKGRWLERGGSAFIVSTAGTGKSIFAMQLALCFAEGRPFAGLTPLRPLRIWIFQTEDSMSRLAIDRADITAELIEQMPDVDWHATWRKVSLFKVLGKVGAEFLNHLNQLLSSEGDKPDAILLNPLLSFIGGQITDGTFVTPFLRGGEINRTRTNGLQFILERHAVGVLCFHHTPKPPSPNEVKAWMRSPFPEYQGGGTADITNWGRSFITMMREPDRPGIVCLTAGKNGAELGWDSIDGAYRRYMAWSRKIGVTGKNRHAWRDLDEYELAEVTKQARANLAADVAALVEALKQTPMTWTDASKNRPEGMTKQRFEPAWKVVTANPEKYGLSKAVVQTTDKRKPVYIGLPDAAKEAAETALRNWKNARRTAN